MSIMRFLQVADDAYQRDVRVRTKSGEGDAWRAVIDARDGAIASAVKCGQHDLLRPKIDAVFDALQRLLEFIDGRVNDEIPQSQTSELLERDRTFKRAFTELSRHVYVDTGAPWWVNLWRRIDSLESAKLSAADLLEVLDYWWRLPALMQATMSHPNRRMVQSDLKVFAERVVDLLAIASEGRGFDSEKVRAAHQVYITHVREAVKANEAAIRANGGGSGCAFAHQFLEQPDYQKLTASERQRFSDGLSVLKRLKTKLMGETPGKSEDVELANVSVLTDLYSKPGAAIALLLASAQARPTETEKQDGAAEGPTQTDDRSLAPSRFIALDQYDREIEQNPHLAEKTDRDVYDWLCEHEENLPSFETWSRYLREARAVCNRQKNTPRKGRHARSVVPKDQV